MLTAGDEPSIHELQHVHWNCLLVKILAFEPATKSNFPSNTVHPLIFESDDSEIFAARLLPNSISASAIDVH